MQAQVLRMFDFKINDYRTLVHILLGTKHVHLDRGMSHHEQKRLRQRREPPRTKEIETKAKSTHR